MKQEIIKDVQIFLSEEVFSFYNRRGIPHRRAYLFYGPPGTGKSSFCRVIATQFDLPIYVINLSTVDNYGLQELFRTLPALPERCIVVLEDFVGIQRGGNSKSQDEINQQERVTLATVLNVLDGVGAHSGHILVVTTNSKPTLDDALTRPGRMDKQYEFQYPDPETMKQYFTFFFQDYCTDTDISKKSLGQLAMEFSQAASHIHVSSATLQEYFLQCKGDPFAAIQNLESLVACQ
jgi:chaperone BCS1